MMSKGFIGERDNNNFDPDSEIDRAGATVIIYRLFLLLYEIRPSELGDVETSNSEISTLAIVGGGFVGIGMIRGIFSGEKIKEN